MNFNDFNDLRNLKNVLTLVNAGYTKDDIVSMINEEIEKKKESNHVKDNEPEPEPDHEKKLEPEPEKKPDFSFDYDKLADNIISKIQESNRSANLVNGKNDKADWLNQLSLKF